MKVRFRTNLGLLDATALKLNWKECLCEKTVEVADKAAEQLIERGIAEAVDQPEAVKGVEKEPTVKGVKAKDEVK